MQGLLLLLWGPNPRAPRQGVPGGRHVSPGLGGPATDAGHQSHVQARCSGAGRGRPSLCCARRPLSSRARAPEDPAWMNPRRPLARWNLAVLLPPGPCSAPGAVDSGSHVVSSGEGSSWGPWGSPPQVGGRLADTPPASQACQVGGCPVAPLPSRPGVLGSALGAVSRASRTRSPEAHPLLVLARCCPRGWGVLVGQERWRRPGGSASWGLQGRPHTGKQFPPAVPGPEGAGGRRRRPAPRADCPGSAGTSGSSWHPCWGELALMCRLRVGACAPGPSGEGARLGCLWSTKGGAGPPLLRRP